jgi:hypothetical protein
MDYAAVLMRKYRGEGDEQPMQATNQCSLDAPEEERPEAAKEPIFTE